MNPSYSSYHGCFGSTRDAFYDPEDHYSTEWTTVKQKQKKGIQRVRCGLKFQNSDHKQFANYQGAFTNARGEVVGLATQDDTFKNETVPIPKKSNRKENQTKQQKKKRKKVSVPSAKQVKSSKEKFDDDFTLLLRGFDASFHNFKQCNKDMAANVNNMTECVKQSKKHIEIQNKYHEKLMDFEVQRVPHPWRSRAKEIYQANRHPERYNNSGRFARLQTDQFLLEFQRLGDAGRQLDLYQDTIFELFKNWQTMDRLNTLKTRQSHFDRMTQAYIDPVATSLRQCNPRYA